MINSHPIYQCERAFDVSRDGEDDVISIIICEPLPLVFLTTGAGLARQVQQADEGAGQGRGLPGEEPHRHPLRHGELQLHLTFCLLFQ